MDPSLAGPGQGGADLASTDPELFAVLPPHCGQVDARAESGWNSNCTRTLRYDGE